MSIYHNLIQFIPINDVVLDTTDCFCKCLFYSFFFVFLKKRNLSFQEIYLNLFECFKMNRVRSQKGISLKSISVCIKRYICIGLATTAPSRGLTCNLVKMPFMFIFMNLNCDSGISTGMCQTLVNNAYML